MVNVCWYVTNQESNTEKREKESAVVLDVIYRGCDRAWKSVLQCHIGECSSKLDTTLRRKEAGADAARNEEAAGDWCSCRVGFSLSRKAFAKLMKTKKSSSR